MPPAVRLSVVILAAVLAAPIQAATARPTLEQGIAEARAGNLVSAVRHFEGARAAGIESPALLHNLGAAHYRLGHYEAARAAFLELVHVPAWRALAHYNLGLVAERTGDPALATRHFRKARRFAAQPKLRALAASKLVFEQHPPAAPVRRWHGLVSLGTGYDDNAILADDQLLEAVSGEGDAFAEILSAARRSLTGDTRRGLGLHISGYYRAYDALDEFDFGSLSATLNWKRAAAGWQFSTGLRGDALFAGGEHYATGLTHRLQMERDLGAELVLQIRNDLGLVAGGSSFEHVSGWRNRTRAQINGDLYGARARLGYEIELNERDDLARDPEFFSYSPLRHRIFGRLLIDVDPRLQLEARAALGLSNYPEPNGFLTSEGELIEAPRDQDVTSFAIRARLQLTEAWNVWAQAQTMESQSPIRRYDYQSTQYMLGVEALF